MSHLKSQILPFLFLFSSFLFLNASDKDEVLMHVLKGGDRTEIGVPKVSYDPDMQVLSVAFQASGDYMLYIINGSGLAECGFRITTNGCVQTFQLPPLPESVYFVVITNGDSAYKGILDTSGYYY